MSEADTLLTMPSTRADRAVPRSLALLIEVPEVKVRRTRRARPRVADHQETRRASPVHRKRRLRREVRIAGCAILALAPLLSAYRMDWSGRPGRVLACSIAEATAPGQPLERGADRREAFGQSALPPVSSAGVVVISIEPAVAAPGTDTKVPVVFPGYVLPDDSREETTHEGS
jgi:hypothetical protein